MAKKAKGPRDQTGHKVCRKHGTNIGNVSGAEMNCRAQVRLCKSCNAYTDFRSIPGQRGLFCKKCGGDVTNSQQSFCGEELYLQSSRK